MGWAALTSGRMDSMPAGPIGELLCIRVQHHIHLAGEGGDNEHLTLFAPFYARLITYRSAAVYGGIDRSVPMPGGFS